MGGADQRGAAAARQLGQCGGHGGGLGVEQSAGAALEAEEDPAARGGLPPGRAAPRPAHPAQPGPRRDGYSRVLMI